METNKKEIKEIKKRLSIVELTLKDNIDKRICFLEALLNKGSLKKEGRLIKCSHCGYIWRTISEAKTVSCSNCGGKTLNLEIKEEDKKDFNAFDGIRYEDYDNREIKEGIFAKKIKPLCDICGKVLNNLNEGYWGYNKLFCRNCYERFSILANEELKKIL